MGDIAVYPKAPNEALQPEGGEAKFKAKPSWMTTRSSGKHNVIASHWVFFFSGLLLQKKNGESPKEKPKVTQCHFFHFVRAKMALIIHFFFCGSWEPLPLKIIAVGTLFFFFSVGNGNDGGGP